MNEPWCPFIKCMITKQDKIRAFMNSDLYSRTDLDMIAINAALVADAAILSAMRSNHG